MPTNFKSEPTRCRSAAKPRPEPAKKAGSGQPLVDKQMERKMAMAKISQTFGYGENPKEQKPNLMSAKERQVPLVKINEDKQILN